jgi:hypothetical protein
MFPVQSSFLTVFRLQQPGLCDRIHVVPNPSAPAPIVDYAVDCYCRRRAYKFGNGRPVPKNGNVFHKTARDTLSQFFKGRLVKVPFQEHTGIFLGSLFI